MRSLHVVTSTARRGAETFAVDLAHALSDRGHDAEVVALTRGHSAASHPIATLGTHRRSITALTALRRAAATADVVVAHGSSTLEACAGGLLGTGVPFVYRNIGDPSFWACTPLRHRAVGAMLRRAGRIAALWPAAATEIARRYGLRRDMIDVIPNAVPIDRFRPASDEDRARARQQLDVPPGSPCLGFVGALMPEKDLGTAIRAVATMHQAVLLVAGDGAERGTLERLAQHLARGRVRFLGALADPRVVYAAADVLVLPSVSEGMPAVVIEAGLSATPSVATRVGALSDMIEDGVTGHLIAPGDPAALAAAVRTALPDARETGARAADVFAARYGLEQVTDKWERTLSQAVRR